MPKTHIVKLGPIEASDVDILFEWINERETVIFNSCYQPVHYESHREWLQSIQKREDIIIFSIRKSDDNTIVGSCQLVDINRVHRSAALQIRVGNQSNRDKGYGSDAVGLLLDFAFRDLNLHRIYLYVFRTNKRAVRVYEKAGLVKEGVLREGAYVDGKYVDVIIMGILRSEYEKQTSRCDSPA